MSSSLPIDQFHLSGAFNFRDVGGARTEGGRAVRSGVLFRSSELSRLDERGQIGLRRLGVKMVFDLRGDSEIARNGDDALPGSVRLRNTPYRNSENERAPHETGVLLGDNGQRDHMMNAYSSYPSSVGASSAIRQIIKTLAAGEGPILVHCVAGKDRAGWTVATVLRAAGVREADIVTDFLRSNSAIEPLRRHMQAVWSTIGNGDAIEAPNDAVLGVHELYYRHGLDAVRHVHGSFESYLHAIGIDDSDLADLKQTLLTSQSSE